MKLDGVGGLDRCKSSVRAVPLHEGPGMGQVALVSLMVRAVAMRIDLARTPPTKDFVVAKGLVLRDDGKLLRHEAASASCLVASRNAAEEISDGN